jgi:K(+)-stimulated pyrophosphate-energized sodium pump
LADTPGFGISLAKQTMRTIKQYLLKGLALSPLFLAAAACGSEADIKIPDLSTVKFDGLGGVSGHTLMLLGIAICAVGALFGIVQYLQTKALPVHESMARVSHSIYETCKTYLYTQGQIAGHPLAADRRLHDRLFRLSHGAQG